MDKIKYEVECFKSEDRVRYLITKFKKPEFSFEKELQRRHYEFYDDLEILWCFTVTFLRGNDDKEHEALIGEVQISETKEVIKNMGDVIYNVDLIKENYPNKDYDLLKMLDKTTEGLEGICKDQDVVEELKAQIGVLQVNKDLKEFICE